MHIQNVFLFDLDGTLVDSVYQHVMSWKEALDEEGVELSVWRIHRKIGMSGGLFTGLFAGALKLTEAAEPAEEKEPEEEPAEAPEGEELPGEGKA